MIELMEQSKLLNNIIQVLHPLNRDRKTANTNRITMTIVITGERSIQYKFQYMQK